uniref:Uncharacterized protein n=1 Tax=Setaria italica TaxID=4555 RepID=K3YBK0_SETIT
MSILYKRQHTHMSTSPGVQVTEKLKKRNGSRTRRRRVRIDTDMRLLRDTFQILRRKH